MVKMRAQFGGMRYALVEALDGNSYMGTSSVLFYSPALALFGMREEAMVTFGSVRSRFVVLANLPGHDNVANKLAQLKARIGAVRSLWSLSAPGRTGPLSLNQ